ncbi:hypothetical protein [Aquimarina algiphila]|uniref:Uncharacterized protein n=1 Tax=Aquimarina algiphila TaxID=2047982 RepID=A0A554VB15_9FLAO|nr:hypothetical protein [Aquimarina algiphila]TSE03482.1 hypothetical protein FOF46_29125 [Aquimarina algiphila]
MAKDFHTIGGKFQYHYHFIESGKFTKGHLSPSLLKQNGYKFNDLWQGLPDVRWKKSPATARVPLVASKIGGQE